MVFRTLFETVISVFNPQKGKDWLKQTLLMTDAEFKIDYFLEAVSSFLATGEISNLYGQKTEKNNVISNMRSCLAKISAALGELDETGVWGKLIEVCKKNIHLSLCFSPSGDSFRDKFIKFPVLFNNCTIIWLLPWPEEALISVASEAAANNKNLNLYAEDKARKSLFEHIAGVHIKISEEVCSSYYEHFRRHVYVTPKSFLSFIQEYMNIYIKKDREVAERAETINGGLSKLKEAEEDIGKQNEEMAVKKDIIAVKKKEVDEKVAISTKKAAEADAIEKEASAVASKCEAEAKIIGEQSEQVQKELALAEPALIAAQKSIEEMEKKEIQPNFTKKTIAISLRLYLECSGIVLGKRLAYQSDFGSIDINDKNKDIKFFNVVSTEVICSYLNSGGPGNYWDTCKDYIKKLGERKLRINDETLELIRPFLDIANKDGVHLFDSDVAKVIGGTGGQRIANFCRDISEYVKCIKDVLPKMDKVEKMKKKYAEADAKLKEKLAEKAAALAEKKKVEDELSIVKEEKERQEEELNKMQKKVNAATHLLDSLKGEKERWTIQSAEFDQQRRQLLGDSAISSAFIAYGGPFNYSFRQEVLLKKLFRDDIDARGIPYTKDMDVKSFLVDETTKDIWLANGLPNDELSIQNGILVNTSSRYPLLIDPQEQAKSWLIQTYEDLANKQYKHIFQMAVFCGKKYTTFCEEFLGMPTQIMLEGIENDVDSCLDPILTKEFMATKGNSASKMRKIKISENEVQFHTDFKLFLLCKLINPHFTPELAAKTTIIDFCVTAIGLEQQLQALVISKEQKILEETLKGILTDIAKNKASLVQCQEEILKNLRKPGNLLDNEEIVQVLNTSKTKAEENTKKIKEAEEKKIDINVKRDKYLPVATRGSVLYFSIVQMQDISKMYSVSLQQFLVLFNYSIDNAIKSNNPDQRVKNIVKKLSEHVYKYVVRGLFERDKTAFILLVCCKILTEEKIEGARLLAPSDINFFIKMQNYVTAANEPDCPYDFLCSKDDKKPKEYLCLQALTKRKFNDAHMYFQRLPEKINADPDKMKYFYNSQEPENYIPYEDLFTQNKKLVSFLKLCFVRALREDRTMMTVTTQFVPTVLEDKDFLKAYAEELKDIYNITDAKTPILFLLSAGADPSSTIELLAKKKNKKLDNVSMGEGQLEIAKEKVKMCSTTGDWVYFQNCHLGLDFMSYLDITLKESEEQWHEEMRIWLSCEPTNNFPIGLLHQSLKITNEPPKGIKAGMLKTYSSVVSAEKLDVFEYKEWRNLVFALSFIHSLVIERRKYGALGFCVPYDFNNSDLEASILFVEKQFQRESDLEQKKQPSEMINFKTLTNVVSGILYGGRITDLKDESLFKTIVSSYVESSSFTQPNFSFYHTTQRGATGTIEINYKIPDGLKEIKQYTDHIQKFPDVDAPEVFGLHSSADMTFRLKEFKELLDTLTTALPKDVGSGGGMSKEEMIKNTVIDFINQLPEEFNEKEYRDTIDAYSFANLGKGIQVPLNNVLLQEIQDVQSILSNVKRTLGDVRAALEGTLLMTETITDCIDAFSLFKPPKV
ncbi:MAG: hypothetical protein MJ252_07210, partial [archaeon]|nr:hypothetical protein [archaeon]